MYEPTAEEAEILEKIRNSAKKRRETAESGRYVTRPEKYDYPIGIDPEGNPYPVHPRQQPDRNSAADG